MSDQTIDQLRASLKDLNERIEKLKRIIDRLDILAHNQKHLIKAYKELSAQCTELSDNLNQIDVVAFEIRQGFDKIQEVCK